MGLFKPNIKKMKAKKDVKGLIKALKDKDHHRKVEAVEALGEIGNAEVVESLIQILNDTEQDIRSKALVALGEIKDERVVEPLIQALKDRDTSVRLRAAEALGRMKDKRAVEPLIQALQDRDNGVQLRAVEALGEIKDERAVEPLIQALKYINPSVRQSAAKALGKMEDKRAVEPLLQALKSQDANVQQEVAGVLAKMGISAEKAHLRIIEESSSFQEVDNAIAALKRINDRAFEQAMGILFNRMTDEKIERRNMSQRVIETNMGLFLNTPSARELAMEVVSVCARMEKQGAKEVVGDLIEMVPRILPYVLGCDPYEEVFREIGTREIDAETTALVLEGVLNFLRRAGETSGTLKEEVAKLSGRICWQDGVCPIGEVDLNSEAMIRKVLLSLPIISPEDSRRNTDPATSTYFDYDDRVKTYSLDEAARNVYSYWAFRASAQTDRYCKIAGGKSGRELKMAKDYKYPDGSGGGRGFTVARLDDSEFLFYGRDLEQWKTSG